MEQAASGGFGFDPTPFLAKGAPGILALVCLFLLWMTWRQFAALINEGKPDKLRAAQPLLFAMMGFTSFIFSVAVFALAWFDSGERTVTLMVRPSVEDVTLVGDNAPSIYFAREPVPFSELSRMIQRSCDAGKVLPIDINFERYIKWRAKRAADFALEAPQAPSAGLVDPEVN